MELEGKIALVTGSSRGIGRGIAIKLAENGAEKVCITYLGQKEEAEETLRRVRHAGSDGIIVQCDVCQAGSITELFRQAKEAFGRLDIFVSNARSQLGEFYQPANEITDEQFEHAFRSQSQAFHRGVRHALELLPDGGRIIAVTYAPSARTGSWQPWVAMGSAKAAMESLCRYYAVLLGERGITVNLVSPGVTDDSVVSRLPPEVFQAIKEWHESGWTPMRRIATPADIGDAVVLLCSDKAGLITGQTLHVDGGQSIMDPAFPLPIQWPR